MPIGLNSDTQTGLYLPGSVVQVVQTITNGTITTTSTSYQNYSALACSITPRYSSSKILIMLSGSIYKYTANYVITGGYIGIYSSRTSSRVFTSDFLWDDRTHQTLQVNLPLCMNYLDSPSTTSTITYTPQYASNGSYAFGFGWGTNSYHSLTLMEIQQ